MKALLLSLLFLGRILSQTVENPMVHCETTKGPLLIEVHRDWAPLGAQRFLDLVQDEFYTNIAFFRCVKRFLTQFGISDNPAKKHWHYEDIKDDPNLNMGIHKNYVSFAGGGPNTRSTQIFIAFEDLDFLGGEPWETPFAVVVEGQSTLDNLYKEYGDIPPFGKGPDQQKIHNRGNQYVRDNFPHTDFLLHCEMVVKETPRPTEPVTDPPVAIPVLVEPPKRETNNMRTRPPEQMVLHQSVEGEPIIVRSDQPAQHSDQDLIITAIVFLISIFLCLYIYLQCINPGGGPSKARSN